MRSSYSRLVRSVSWLLIFAMLALQTVSVPMISSTRASSLDHADLVSIIVDTDTYSGETAGLIDRYARDIQATQNNIRVAIFTVPPDVHPDRVAALNEKLYYEGDGAGLSNLVGTIIVGKVPLPVVHAEGQAFLSIYPYVDFREKNFLYRETSGKFEKSANPPLDPAPEIWHSVVSPDTGTEAGDRADLRAFFDKTHAFHTSSGQFAPAETESEPSVFYFDGYHDQQSTSLVNWKSYERYMEHQEDFAYSRYNKHLARELVTEMQGDMNAELGEGGRRILDTLGQTGSLTGMNFDLIPDIQSKLLIEKAVNPFYEILNAKYVGDILRYVYNAGRYGDAKNVRVDVASVLVAKKDQLVRDTLRSANDLFEGMVDQIVKDEIATKLTVLDTVTYGIGGSGGHSRLTYKNYFYGTAASAITDPRQCSITRGSSLLVEANRGYNIMRTQEDAERLTNDLDRGRCYPRGVPQTLSLWGGNTPLNLDTAASSAGSSSIALKYHRYKGFFEPIFDLGGAREIPYAAPLTTTPAAAAAVAMGRDPEAAPTDPTQLAGAETLRVSSPMDCLDNSLILQPYRTSFGRGGTYEYPPETDGQRLSCLTDIRIMPTPASVAALGSCATTQTVIDGEEPAIEESDIPTCVNGETTERGVRVVYRYKTIPSIIQHKSPNEEELVAASRGIATPSLAMDRDRYTDFLDGRGQYARVDYPNLFRIEVDTLDDLNPEYVRQTIETALDAVSTKLNAMPRRSGTGTTVDLYARLAARPEALSAVVESVLWDNLTNATAKYRFILEKALDSSQDARSSVADHKKDYEIASMNSLGDAANMYVKIDPEGGSATSEIERIQQAAASYRALRDASNLPGVEENASFRCGPPDGVVIWEWLPAVFCWMNNLLPPSIEGGSCTDSNLVDLANAATDPPRGDADGNGILDAIESVRYGEIVLASPSPMYTYGSQVPLSATIRRDGLRLGYDSTSVVRFDVSRIVAYSGTTASTVYDAADPARRDTAVLGRYMSFRASDVPADRGLSEFGFSVGNLDADITLSASVKGGGFVADMDSYEVRSNPLTIRVRGDRLDVVSRTREDDAAAYSVDSSLAAGNPYGVSFTVDRRDRLGAVLPNAGTLTYRVYDERDMLVSGDTPRVVAGNTVQFTDAAVLRKAGVYRFEFTDADGLSATQEIVVLPAPVASLSVSLSTSVFVRGQAVQALVRPLDAYGNVVMGDVVTIEGSSIAGPAKFAQIGSGGAETLTGSLSVDTVEGYHAFELRAESAGSSLLKFRDPVTNTETALIPLKSVDSARLAVEVADAGNIVVGKEAHSVAVKVVGDDGAPIAGYSAIVALEFPKVSGVFSPAFVQVVDGVNRDPVTFTPAYVAGRDLAVTATLPGVTGSGAPVLTVRPDVPMETSLAFDRSAVEADSDDTVRATATLYDRYGNIATGHPVPMTAKFDLDSAYRRFARFDGNAFSTAATFSGGTATVNVHPTMLPGAAYVRVTADPSISGNTFTVTTSTGATVTARGISEAAAKFDSYYFYNREKLDSMRYNALYTVLGGAAYADVTHGNSLGNAMIFRPESRSLAVTGLVNSPFSNDWLFSLTPAGQYRERSGDASIGLQTTVSVRDGYLGLTWYDATVREHIADADISAADGRTALVACQGADTSACAVPGSGRYAILSGENPSVVATSSGGTLSLSAGARTLVSLDSRLRATVDPTVQLVPDTAREGNLLWFAVQANGQAVGRLGLALSGVALGADEAGDIRVRPVSNRYGHERTYLGNSSRAERGVRFFRIDSTSGQVDQVRSGPYANGLENSTKRTGIGWEGDNTFLLEFAAGATVGEATRLHASYSTLNLGDPFARVPHIPNTNGSPFDQTIGKRLLDTGENIESVEKIDFNHDATDDLVVFLESGRIRLFANYSGNLKDMGYLAAVADAGKKRKGVGDFSGDDYPDIVGADVRGKIFILANTEGRFDRIDPVIVDATGQRAEIRGAITSLHVYDMDRDGRDDIVTVDDSGELSILYGRPDGSFEKLLVSSDFAVKLTGQVLSSGGAAYYRGLRQLPSSYDPAVMQAEAAEAAANAEDPEGAFQGAVVNNLLDREIYYQDEWYETTEPEREPTLADWTVAAGTDDEWNPNTGVAVDVLAAMRSIEGRGATVDLSVTPTRTESRTYIRSTFSEGAGIRVAKTLTDVDGEALRSGDAVAVELKITNTGPTAKQDVEYLDSIDRSVLKTGPDMGYTIERSTGTGGTQGTLQELVRGSFDLSFALGRLAAGETATIRYRLVARSIGYAEVIVGDLEPATPYGEIATRANNICGTDYSVWRPIEPYPRTYQAGTLSLDGTAPLPAAVTDTFGDADGNGIPDMIEMVSDPTGNASELQSYAREQLDGYLEDSEADARAMARGPSIFRDTGGGSFDLLAPGGLDGVNRQIDDLVSGLGCGFGGGSCLALPINWAPLAPGAAPAIFGFPAGPLIPETWVPVFSSITGIPSPFGCIPSVWPASPLGWAPSPTCSPPSAGGVLGTWNPTNYFRLYVTPTLTLGMGVAACFGGSAAVVGRMPPPGVSPIVPGGNCIIAAAPLFSCGDDGSEWNASSLGLPQDAGWYVNANSCRMDEEDISAVERETIAQAARDYVASGGRSPSPVLTQAMSRGTIRQTGDQPLVGIGLGTGAEPDFEIAIDSDAISNFDIGSIVKINNSRVSAFPDFLMKWVTRQMEEVINKLTSLPTLYVVLPDFSGLETSGWADFPDKLRKQYEEAAAASEGTDLSIGGAGTPSVAAGAVNAANDALTSAKPMVDRVGRNVSGIKAAYEFMSNLPLIEIEPEQYDVRIPWIPAEDLDKWLIDAEATADQWDAEISRAREAWGSMDNSDAILSQLDLQTAASLSSLDRNIRTIREYRDFPDKLLKYLKYKEIYAEQILCNVESIEFMLGGWLADNAKRFKTWVELYLLVKTVLKSWQAVVDLFVSLDQECGVCRNERFDLKHFIFKILSGIIPSPPIIRFPKWPDIILDLHSIRAGLRIPLPEFDFRIVPLVLPDLPRLSLPDVPTGSIGLPALPQLPPLPRLPELPDLPSLPVIELPDLPPPPKIPKLFGVIAAVLDILKLIGKILCILKLVPFAPEWRAGDIIAQLTERQGTLPIDFLFVEFPEFSMSFIDAIQVSSKVNLEFETDFVTAMMAAAVEPLNSFSNNLSRSTDLDLIRNIDLRGVIPEHVDADVRLDGSVQTEGLDEFGNVRSPLDAMAPFVPVDSATGIPLYSTGSVIAWANVIRIGFPKILAALETHAQTETTLAEFRQALSDSQRSLATSDHPKMREVADILARGLEESRDPVDTVTEAARQRSQEKFDLVREYLRRYRSDNQRDIAELNAVIRGDKDLANSSIVDGVDIVQASAPAAERYPDLTKRLDELNSQISAPLSRILDPSSDPELSELSRLGTAAMEPLRRLAIADELTVGATAPVERAVQTAATGELDANNLASDYRYNYEGIYYRTPAGVQTRLFNYTDLLSGDERVEEFDPDMDGDADIVYVMDDAVFIKENHTSEPAARHRSESVRTRSLDSFVDAGHPRQTGYRAPDHFLEDFASSGRINGSFLAADAAAESRYRLEMYPYIDRFDRIASGQIERSIAPSSRKESIDLVPDISARLANPDIAIVGGSAQRSYATVVSAVGDFTVGGVEYETVERGQRILLRAGSRLSSRLGSVRIFVRPDADTAETEYLLPASHSIGFDTAMDVRVAEGTLVIARQKAYDPATVSGDALRGMPIVPGMRIDIPAGGRLMIEYYDGIRSVFDTPSVYECQSLGTADGEYSFGLSRENKFYYARLAAFDGGGFGTWANLTLLAPQIAADTEAPSIYVSDTLRVPVYQSRAFSLREQVSDASPIREIYYDLDLSTDSDSDGDPANDRDSAAAEPTLPLRTGTGAGVYDVRLGAFDTLMIRPIRIHVIDAAGNKAFRDLKLEVYAPVPSISGRDASGALDGNLSEALIGEPVDLMRIRDGFITRIAPIAGTGSIVGTGGVLTGTGGFYRYIPAAGTGAAVWDGDTVVARVSDVSGALRPESGYRVGVEPKDSTHDRMAFTLTANGSTETLYRQRLELPTYTPIVPVADFAEARSPAVYVRVVDPLSRYAANIMESPSLPSGAFVADRDARAVFGIDATAALVDVRSGVSYAYSEREGYPLVTVSVAGSVVAEVWYRIPFAYAVR